MEQAYIAKEGRLGGRIQTERGIGLTYSTGSGQGGGGQGNLGEQSKGFIGSLFDFSFRNFVTAKIIGVLYIISVVIIALYTVFLIVAAFEASPAFGAVTLLILGPLVFLVSVIYVRVLLEIAIVLFRISENTSEMVRQGRRE